MVTGRSPSRDRSRLTLVVVATALALVWFLPNISLVVAQDSGSVVETTTTTTSTTSTTSTSTTSTTQPPLGTTTTTTSPILGVQSILLQLGATTAAPGDPVGGSGQGAPNSTIGLTFFSHPVFLGDVTTDANGNFLFTFNVPLDAEPGVHTVEAVGRSGERGSASITIVPPASAQSPGYPLPVLPYGSSPYGATPVATPGAAVPTAPASSAAAYTGMNVWGLTVLAGAALALGAMALTFGRLQPLIELPGRNRRRLQWAHRAPRLMKLRQLDGADVVQVGVCVALAVALGLSLARQ